MFGSRQIVSSRKALADHNIEPLPLKSKEHLGILNGTAFSASVASLALNDAVHLALLAQVCTAMGTEALVGTRGSFAPFIHDVARPHPGQVITIIANTEKYALTHNIFTRSRLPVTSGTFSIIANLQKRLSMKLASRKIKDSFARIATPCARHLNF